MNEKNDSKYILSKETIIEYIYKENKPISKKKIELFFGVNKQKSIKKLLEILIKEGRVIKLKKNFFESSLPINKEITFQVTKIDNNGIFSYPLKLRKKTKKINPIIVKSDDLINRLEVGQKFYGIISLDQNQNYYVNFIRNLEAQQREYIYGLVHFKNNKFLLQPDETKKKFVEIIRTNNNIIINKGQLIKALQIKDGKKTIKAKVLEVLGSIYSANDLNNYLAIRHNLPLEFSKEIEKEADNLSKINIYTKERKDLRELDFITIDPSDAMDHDDAIWASQDLEPTNIKGWNIKIAIADVSYYVKERTLIDIEALKRSFSIYFPNKVIPMLPFNLSSNLCSLKTTTDRPAIVVDIKIGSNGEILAYDFFPALVNISANLNYEEFNEFLEKKQIPKKYKYLKKTILNLIESYNSLKTTMLARHPLNITSQELKISIKNDAIQKISPSITLESHKLVEEFMVTANLCAANFIIKNKIKSLFRVHEKPSLSKIYELNKTLKDLNIKFFLNENISTMQLNQLLSKTKNKKDFNIINLSVLRCQSQANYSYNNIGHFGLSLSAYTHFTSPIRRYADLMIHRSILEFKNQSIFNKSRNILPLQISTIERSNMLIERKMQSIYSALFLSNKIGEVFEAYVTSIKRFGIFINLKKINFEGLIHKRNLGKDSFSFDFNKGSFIGKKNKETFHIGDDIKVKLIDINILLGQLSFERIL